MHWMWNVAMIVAIIAIIVAAVFYFLNKWAGKKNAQQQDMVNQHKQTTSIFVIDKKKEKITTAHFSQAIIDQMPRMAKMMKTPLVKVKVGPQIMTMLCDEAVFAALPVKKTVTVEVAGAYIVGMKGLKTKMEMQELRNARRKDGAGEEKSGGFMAKIKSMAGR